MWAVGLVLGSVVAALMALASWWLSAGARKPRLVSFREHLQAVLKKPGTEVKKAPARPRPPATTPSVQAPSVEVLQRRQQVLQKARQARLAEGGGGGPLTGAEESSEPSSVHEEEEAGRGGLVMAELGIDDDGPLSHELYGGFVPQAKKLYDMLGYVYEMGPDDAPRAREGEEDRGARENDLLRDLLLQSASNVSEFVPRHLGDWNERFQRAMEAMALLNDSSVSLNERIRVGRDLINLSQDFIHLSTMYGRVIISEAFLPNEQKTIRPTKIGGMAGGEKYVVCNIMFKFALDSNNVLGSDYAATKVAGHELKGLLAVLNARVSGISVPLMTLVDYMGFRLIAMSILPISRQTIVYGSSDCGQTVHTNAHPAAVSGLKILARRLNLKPHYCGVPPRKPAKVYGPCDLEGHQSDDGRFYLLDFSRMMPPETPRPNGPRMAHLYRLLRPEFVMSYVTPLCSDGYSKFIQAHNAVVLNRELAKATALLQNELIPQFAPEFSSALIAEVEAHGWRAMETFRVSEALHRRGINIRYLGLLRKHTSNSDVRTFLLIEIFARVIKNLLRLLLREKMKSLRLPLEEPYRKLVVDYLNLLFGESDQSDVYWNTVIRKNVMANFYDALSREERNESFFLKPTLTYFSGEDVDGKYLLFMRIAAMSGLEMSLALLKDLQEKPNAWAPRGNEPFDDVDLISISTRTKHMGIINQTIGYNYMMRAHSKTGTDLAAAERLLRMAQARFQEALETQTRNPDVLCNLGLVSMRLLECTTDWKKLDYESDPALGQIEGYFLRAEAECAEMAGSTKSRVCCSYGNFLESTRRFAEAEVYYLRALEADPNNDQAYLDYGNMLQSRGEFEAAEQVFMSRNER